VALPGERKELRLNDLWLVAIVALVARLAFALDVHGDPAFSILAIDARFYARVAERFARGDWLLGTEPLWYGPLYPVVVGFLYRVFGPEPGLVRWLQHALGIATAVGVTAIGARFGRPVARIGGILFALSPVVIFYESQLLMVSFALAATTAFLALFLVSLDSRDARAPRDSFRWRTAGGAGLAFGALALLRTNAIVFAPVAVACWMLARRPRAAIAFVVGVAVVLTPLLLRNGLVSGAWTPLTVNGGMIFATGFAEDAVGGRALVRSPEDFGPGGTYQREAEEAVGHPLSLADAAAFHRDQAVRRIRDDPGQALRLTGRKLGLLFAADEIDDNLGFAFLRDRSWVLRALPRPWMLVTILAAIGGALAVFGGRPDRRAIALVAFAVTYGASLLLAFVNARYRLPLYVPGVLLAGYGVLRTSEIVRAGERRRLGAAGLAGLAAALLTLHDPGVSPDRAIQFASFGAAMAESGHFDEALAAADRALSLDPALPGAHLNRALALMSLGRNDEALPATVRARELDPTLFDAWMTEGALRARAGAVEAALPAFERAVTLRPDDAAALLNLSQALSVVGRTAEAIEWGQRAADRGAPRAASLVDSWRRRLVSDEAVGRP
jgi:tetratricopeptide (TPR) repeat protein